ncbi:hypothetical protein BV898_06416 [Hypsibius exemplaris]|uniref:Uncharacterized protein n=1 Tax=Hypsibius exemplaris TaxID=2072580 RepID=A0A1W0WWR7_HYPEX|nr:hypothetical protein BV898_06416 [Hypsibius exemplaris]
MSLITTGLKLNLIERIVANQVDHQDVNLYMSGPPATSASVDAATAVVVSAPTISQDTIADLVQHLELRPHAAKTREDAGFTSGSDVKLITSEKIGFLGLLFGDLLKIRQWLKSEKPLAQVTHPPPALFATPSSTTVLQSDHDSDDTFEHVFPYKNARELSRPHEESSEDIAANATKITASFNFPQRQSATLHGTDVFYHAQAPPKTAGYEPQHFSIHSFCRGAATFAAAAGNSEDVIKAQGTWRSSCYQRYIDQDVELRQQFADQVMEAVSRTLS